MTLADRVCVSVVLAASLLLPSHRARAQSAEAEVLFRDGRALIKDGKIAQGCDKLEASSRLEPSVGTLLNVGDCREKLGQLASSWAAFRKAEALAKRTGHDDKRQTEASRRAFRLEPQLLSMTIDVSHPVDGLVVRRNELDVDKAMWNTPLPVDPGTYTIDAEAPGYQPWRQVIQINSKIKRQFVVVPQLEHVAIGRATESPKPPTVIVQAPRPLLPRVLPVTVVEHPAAPGLTTARKVSLGFGIAGVAALGTGIYFGIHARDLQSQADQRCPLTVCADPIGLRLNDNARASASGANVLYAAGGAAVVTAIVLWVVGKPGQESTVIRPTLSDRQVGVTVAGSF